MFKHTAAGGVWGYISSDLTKRGGKKVLSPSYGITRSSLGLMHF